MNDGHRDIDSDILLLYEFALSIGNSLDAREVCRAFTQVLMARKDLSYTGVWIRSSRLHRDVEEQGYELIHALPDIRAGTRLLHEGHPSLQFATDELCQRVGRDDPRFKRISTESSIVGGTYALFRLGDFGLLKLYTQRDNGFSNRELNQLRAIVKKFAIALEGALAHQALRLQVTARELAQHSLEHQRALLRSLIDSVPDLVFFKDPNSVYMSCNKAFERYLGQPEEAIVGRTDFDFVDRHMAERYRAEDAALIQTGNPLRYEEWLSYPDGHRVLLDILKTPCIGPDGEVLGLIGTCRDITQSKQAEEKLRHSEERYRSVVNNIREVVFQTDTEGLFSFLNRAWTDVTGFPVKATLGQPAINYIHPADRALYQTLLAPLLNRQTACLRHEFRCLHQFEGFRWIEICARLTLDDNQAVIGCSGTLNDITERKQAAEEIARKKRFMDLLFRLSTSFINLPLTQVNSSIQNALGEMARFVGADRSYIFDYHFDTDTASNTFEWCAPGIRPQIETLQNLPLSGLSEWVERHKRGQVVYVPEVAKLPEGSLRRLLEPQEIKSLITIPLISNGRCIGFTGFDSVARPSHYDQGEVRLLELFGQMLLNVAERKRAEEKLQLAANVFTQTREGIMITDPDGLIVDINDAFARITGYHHHEVIGRKPSLLKSDRQSPEFYTQLWCDLLEKGYWSGEIWNRRKDGEIFPQMITISAVRNARGETQHYVALFTDISMQKAHQQQLEYVAHHDALTDLPNRILLADRLQQAIVQMVRRNKKLAVAYLDLDGFKTINDQHGHDIGDRLLVDVAKRMKEILREGDTIARLGGDEFVALLIDLNNAGEALPLVNRIHESVKRPFSIDGLLLEVSASIGITYYPQAVEIGPDQLLRQADQAMYQAKQSGKNRYYEFDGG